MDENSENRDPRGGSREGSAGLRLYFCHGCNRQITNVSAEFQCPRCQSGFIEELGEESLVDQDDNEDFDDPPMFGGGQPVSLNDVLSSVFAASGFTPGPGAASGTFRPQGATSGLQQGHQPGQGMFRISGGSGGPTAQISFGAPGGGPNQNPFFDNLLANLMGMQVPGAGGEGQHIHFIPAQLHGNPGDYAWGRGGLDAIVTNLLNQMDGAGPPPLAKDDIRVIPKIKVNKEQIEKNAQCSVCWEDFKLEEEVRQLNCEHIYHEPCIIPWLELHGTCPVCRKSQGSGDLRTESDVGQNQTNSEMQQQQQPQQQANAESSTGNPLSSFLNLIGLAGSSNQQPQQASQPPPSATSATTATTATSSSATSRSPGNNDGSSQSSNRRNNEFEDFDLE